MAAEVQFTGSGPSTRFYGAAEVIDQNTAGNYSTIRFYAQAFNGPSGNSSSYYGGAGSQLVTCDEYGVGVYVAGNPFLPSGYAQNQERWSDFEDHDIDHDSSGRLGPLEIRMTITGSHDFTGYDTFSIPRIARAPSKIATPTASNVATTGFRVNYTAPSDNGGDSIDGYDVDWATNSAFTGATRIVRPASPLYADLTGLAPGTTHYVRVRPFNGVADAPWSNTLTQTTLPAVAPGLVVEAAPSGMAATLTFSPPGGVSGVTKYTWQRRVTGTTTPVSSADSLTTVSTVTGLTPGTSYDWRASAWIGTYQSPWTNWQTLVQPRPNTNPGDFFDGATTDSADLNYQWVGTANASVSTATAQVPEGWEATFATQAAGVLLRVTAGLFQEFAARVQLTTDATVAGCRFGQKALAPYWSDVTAGAPYSGSIHVKLSRANSVGAEISWYTAAGALVSRSPGTAVSVGVGVWTRLAVLATAPATAERAVVRMIDITGTGWSVLRGGDVFDLDGAMITLNEQFPYFDGDTLFDGTYVYEWEGTANASTSTRTPLDQVDLDAMVFGVGGLMPVNRSLIDPDCAPVPVPPRPPTIPADCIDEVGLWRRYYLQIPAAEISDWLDVVPTIEITTGAAAARQVRIRYYANPDALVPGQVDVSSWISEQIISYMPPATTLTLDGIQQRAYAEVAGTEPLSADHLLYGTAGRPATWPVLSCGIDYLVSLEVPTGEPVGNITVGAALTVRT